LLLLACGRFFVDGYWAWKNDPDPYERYIRIENDSGFYCVLDAKSSFRSQVIGDSITTPMNGKNAIFWFPGSGDIMISGEENGKPHGKPKPRINILGRKTVSSSHSR
jgi:hypothetical protein